jgi:hypothetical protein
MTIPKTSRISLWLSLVALLFAISPMASPGHNATGQYDIYCDGVGFFLTNIDGVPAPGKLLLFSYMSTPGGTFGGRYIGQGNWTYAFVYRDGCIPDGKCEKMADGKVWIDEWDTPTAGAPVPKRISGKYEIDFMGEHLEGNFAAKQHLSKHPLRLCM